MGIKIGHKNKINKSIISNNVRIQDENLKDSFFHQHPFITSVIFPVLIAFIFLFSFWDKVISYIESVFF